MGKKKVDYNDPEDFPRFQEEFPPIPPPPPPGGWFDKVRAKVENVHEPPKGGTYAPMPEDPLDIRRFDLRIGKITFAMNHPLDPENLVLTYINVGEPFPRPVVSSIGKFYTKQDLEDRMVVALCNLEPMEQMNVVNSAMLMCAKGSDSEGAQRYELWDPPPKVKVGDPLRCEGYPKLPQLMSPELPYMRRIDQHYEPIVAGISVNSNREVVYNESNRLFVRKRAGYITTASLSDCPTKEEIV